MVVRAVAPTLLALALAAPTCAQSLAEAARQSGQKREAAGGATVPKLTNKDLPAVARLDAALRDVRLDDVLFGKFDDAHLELLEKRTTYRDLDEFLAKVSKDVSDPLALEGVYANTPEVMKILDRVALTPYAYILVQEAFTRAQVDAARTDAERELLPPDRRANADWVIADPRKSNLVQAGISRWAQQEQKLNEARSRRVWQR